MSSLAIFNAAEKFLYITFPCAVFFNSLLIYLTIYHTKKIHKTYQCLIVIFSTDFLIFSISEFLITPFCHSYNSGFILFAIHEGYEKYKYLQSLFLDFYIGLFTTVNCFFSVLFIYRYWVLIKSPYLRFFNSWRLVYWIFYSVLCGAFITWTIYVYCAQDDYAFSYMENAIQRNYGKSLNDMPVFYIIVYIPCGDTTCIRWKGLVYITSLSIIMLISFSIVGYCAINMQLKMKEMLSIHSRSHQNLQRQFFKALLFQCSAPVLTFFIPVALIFSTIFTNFKIDFPSGLSFSSFSIYPSVDCIILMTVVTEYRKAIKRLTGFGKTENYKTTVTATAETKL